MDMKSRKVVTRSGRNFRGYFPSWKLRRMVEWESQIERDAILLFEFSCGVVSYQEQPELIQYESEGEIHRYYPDFEVVLKSGEIIHFEVKPASKLKSPELIKKLIAIKHHYDRLGLDFRILSDDQIRVNPRLNNLMHLTKFQFNQGDYSGIQYEITDSINSHSNPTIRSLAEIYGLVNILVLISRQHIIFDLDVNLFAENNPVRLPREADDDSIFF